MPKLTWHNKLHIEMPHGLINDPNGLCFYKDKYHIFFQWNPETCAHANKHWGHIETSDFIHYTTPEIALAPTDSFDANGCYSGSARIVEDQLHLYYTANLKDKENRRFPTQILAKQNQEGSFTKIGPIISKVPTGYTPHFRDPYFFTHSQRNFIIIGAQRAQDLTGCCLIYEEINAKWELRGELKTNLPNFGYMWECPNLITIEDTDILIFCPQGIAATPLRYKNRYQAGYIAGNFDPDTLEFTHGEFIELDLGFDFYAPQVLVTPQRHLLIGWVGMPEELDYYPTATEGWMHSLTIPRELTLSQGKLLQTPIKEFEQLELKKNNPTKLQTFMALANTCKLTLDLASIEKSQEFFSLTQGNTILKLSVDIEKQLLTMHRESPFAPTDVRYLPYTKSLEELSLYVDTSIIELYLNHGETVATTCFFAKDLSLPKNLKLADNLYGNLINLDSITGLLA